MLKKKCGIMLASIIMTAFLCLGTFGTAQAAPGVPQLGVVDYLYLIENHPDTAKANEALRAEQEQAKKEYEAKAPGLGDKEKQDLDRQLGMRVEQKRQALLKPIADSVNAAMKAVSEAKGMIAVMHKNTVALGGTDITEEVLKKLNGK